MPARRTHATLVRYAPEELALVRERARARGLPTARFIREASLGAAPRARHVGHVGVSDALLRELARVTSSLSQLARAAQDEGCLALGGRIDAALGQLLDAVRQLVRCGEE
jgi:hypothetical protein